MSYRQDSLIKQIIITFGKPIFILFLIFITGTLSFYTLGYIHDKGWSFIDCAYMAGITLTTVGYSDWLNASSLVAGQVVILLVAFFGLGATLFSVSTVTAFLVEGQFKKVFLEYSMQKKINNLKGHSIICGAGQSGLCVALEHQAKNHPFLLIDKNEKVIESFLSEYPDFCFILGDATLEDVLVKAGIRNANSLIACLDNDKDNMFLLVSARFLNPQLTIVVKCENPHSTAKFLQAKANYVVNPALIGGIKMASHVLGDYFKP